MTESTTSNMDNVQQKHEEIGTCFCKDCHHSRMERIQKERKQLQVNRLILQNTNYGHIHYVHHVTMERTYELSIQPVTAIKVKTNEHELQPTTIDVAKSQDIEDNNVQVNMQTEVKIFKDHMETITYYDAVREPTHYYLENMDQNNENYSDPLSHEDKNVLPMDSEYYLGVKKKTQQRIGRQVSFNLLTSQVLGYNEPCQWKQINSTHMGPVHCVNRKRKKKRTSQGLSKIELQHVKMKNLQHSFNLMRMLIKYII